MARRSLPRSTRLANIASKRPKKALRIAGKQTLKLGTKAFSKMFPQLGALMNGKSMPGSLSSNSNDLSAQMYTSSFSQILENQNKQNDILNQILQQIRGSNINFFNPNLINPLNNNQNNNGIPGLDFIDMPIPDSRDLERRRATRSKPSRWRRFMKFIRRRSPTLFRRVGVKLLRSAGLALVPIAGWIGLALTIGLAAYDLVELANLWQEFTSTENTANEMNNEEDDDGDISEEEEYSIFSREQAETYNRENLTPVDRLGETRLEEVTPEEQTVLDASRVESQRRRDQAGITENLEDLQRQRYMEEHAQAQRDFNQNNTLINRNRVTNTRTTLENYNRNNPISEADTSRIQQAPSAPVSIPVINPPSTPAPANNPPIAISNNPPTAISNNPPTAISNNPPPAPALAISNNPPTALAPAPANNPPTTPALVPANNPPTALAPALAPANNPPSIPALVPANNPPTALAPAISNNPPTAPAINIPPAPAINIPPAPANNPPSIPALVPANNPPTALAPAISNNPPTAPAINIPPAPAINIPPAPALVPANNPPTALAPAISNNPPTAPAINIPPAPAINIPPALAPAISNNPPTALAPAPAPAISNNPPTALAPAISNNPPTALAPAISNNPPTAPAPAISNNPPTALAPAISNNLPTAPAINIPPAPAISNNPPTALTPAISNNIPVDTNIEKNVQIEIDENIPELINEIVVIGKREIANKAIEINDASPINKNSIFTLNLKEFEKINFEARLIRFESTGTLSKSIGLNATQNPGGIGNGISGLGNITGSMGNITGDGRVTNGSAAKALEFFQSKGWSLAQAAGIVANLDIETGGTFNPAAVGDGGKAYGIAQWHPDRQAHFQSWAGRSIRGSTFEQQLEFVQFELTEGREKRAGNRIRQTTTPQDAAAITDQFYERSDGTARARRIRRAITLAGNAAQDATQTNQASNTGANGSESPQTAAQAPSTGGGNGAALSQASTGAQADTHNHGSSNGGQNFAAPVEPSPSTGADLAQAGTDMVAGDQRQVLNPQGMVNNNTPQSSVQQSESPQSNPREQIPTNEIPLRNRLESTFSYRS